MYNTINVNYNNCNIQQIYCQAVFKLRAADESLGPEAPAARRKEVSKTIRAVVVCLLAAITNRAGRKIEVEEPLAKRDVCRAVPDLEQIMILGGRTTRPSPSISAITNEASMLASWRRGIPRTMAPTYSADFAPTYSADFAPRSLRCRCPPGTSCLTRRCGP
jgi:hypothetical protein